MDYPEAIDYLYGLQSHGIKLGLDNSHQLMQRAGMPAESFRSVHIAGTNGKGSTAAALQSMMRAQGLSTGLFTSPHMLSFTERISVNGQPITEAEVAKYAIEIQALSQGLSPTFFEVVTLMGFMHFKHKGVDWAVIETGLGGRLDSTNVLKPDCTIITPVGLDHSDFLGETIREVAGEKAGIIKPDTPLVLAPQEPEALKTITSRAMELNAPVSLLGEDFSYSLSDEPSVFTYKSHTLKIENLKHPLRGDYQCMNASLAIRSLEILLPQADLANIIKNGLNALKWPGRMEQVEKGIFLDGAHNPAATEALAGELKNSGMTKICLVMGIMADKNISEVLAPLLPLAAKIIFTAPAYGRSAKADQLKTLAQTMGYESETAADTKEAIKAARASDLPILITGSFYLLGEALETLGHKGVLTDLRETLSESQQ